MGITTTPHCTWHHPRRHVCWCPGHGGKVGGKVGTSASGGLWLGYLGNAPGVLAPRLPWGFKFYHRTLELFTQGPKCRYKRVVAHMLALGQQLEKTNRKREITELKLAACYGCDELLKQHFPASAPLLSAWDLMNQGFTLFRPLFLILAPSLSPSLGIFFQRQPMYISFFLHNVFLAPWQYFSCSNLLSSHKDINPIPLNPAS